MYEQIATIREIIEMYIRNKPDSSIGEIADTIGIENTARIFENKNLLGKICYIPSLSTLHRVVMPIIIRKRLRGLNKEAREEMIKKLSKAFGRGKSAILKMERLGKYFRY